jgi:hypothetical protein
MFACTTGLVAHRVRPCSSVPIEEKIARSDRDFRSSLPSVSLIDLACSKSISDTAVHRLPERALLVSLRPPWESAAPPPESPRRLLRESAAASRAASASSQSVSHRPGRAEHQPTVDHFFTAPLNPRQRSVASTTAVAANALMQYAGAEHLYG